MCRKEQGGRLANGNHHWHHVAANLVQGFRSLEPCVCVFSLSLFPFFLPEVEGFSGRIVERQLAAEPCNAASQSNLDQNDGGCFLSTAVLVATGDFGAGALLSSCRASMVEC